MSAAAPASPGGEGSGSHPLLDAIRLPSLKLTSKFSSEGDAQNQPIDIEARLLATISLDPHHDGKWGTPPAGPAHVAAGLASGVKSGITSLTSLGHKIADIADVNISLFTGKEKADEPSTLPVKLERRHREVCRTLEETSWDELGKTATGVRSDYFSKGVDSIRTEWPGQMPATNLVKTMQVGLTLLHYTGSKFERRCLKVDEQLRFFYILGPADPKSPRQPSSARGNSPVTIPLPHVKHTFSLDHAMHICEKNGVATHELQLDSIFVVLVDCHEATGKEKDYNASLDENMPTMKHIQIFVCQAENRLSNFIQAAIDLSQGLDSTAGKHQPARVDTIGLVGDGLDELLDKGAEKIQFDISFKHEKRMRTIQILSEAVNSDDLGGVTKKLAGELLPVDYSRVVHVIQDAAALRRNILCQHNEIVKRGILKFVQDWSSIEQPTSPEVNLDEPVEEASSLSRALETASEVSAKYHYEDSGIRAVLQTMKYMFEVEKAVQDLTKMKEEDSDDEKVGVEEHVKEPAPKEPAANVTSTQTPVPLRLSDARWKCSKCGFICLAPSKACQVCGTLATAAAATDGATTPSQMVPQTPRDPTTESTAGVVSTADIANAGTVGAVPPVNLAAVAREQEDLFPAPSPPASEREAAHEAAVTNYFGRRDPLNEAPPEPDEDKRGSGSVFACAGAGMVCATPRNQERGKDSNDAQEPKDCILQ